jgi:tetratricopeptide (TPR) repeat protein
MSLIPSRPIRWWPGLALVAATVVAYLPAFRAGTIWDDDWYLTENVLLDDLPGLGKLWLPGNTPQYYPAVFTTFWVERRLWGLEPAGYHAVNVLLHAANALLVWRLGRVLALPGAWFLAAAFALHPVHVESVAWITERKNVLSGFFYLSAALAWLRFLDAPGARRWYAASLALFVLALLSKSVTCTLPAALILILLWQRRPITVRSLAALAPMFLVGLALGLHTAVLERTRVGAVGPEFDFGFSERLLIAARALCFYPRQLLWPWPLMFVYPRWEPDASRLASYAPVVAVLLVAAAALAGWRRGVRGPALALSFFAGTLFPALGFFNVYPMRYSFVADHFQYLASLGVLALIAGGAASLRRWRAPIGAAGAAALAGLAVLTWRQCAVYADEETLWRETARRNPGAWIAPNNLAELASKRGAHAEALELLRRALALGPAAPAADQIRGNLAATLGRLGRYEEALEEYRAVHRSRGGQEVKLAQTLERLGRDDESEALYGRALAGAGRLGALVPFGLHLLRRGRPEEAVETLEAFLRERPDDADARMFLADAYAGAGRIEDAIRSGERALELARARGQDRMAELIRRRLGQYRAGPPPAPPRRSRDG